MQLLPLILERINIPERVRPWRWSAQRSDLRAIYNNVGAIHLLPLTVVKYALPSMYASNCLLQPRLYVGLCLMRCSLYGHRNYSRRKPSLSSYRFLALRRDMYINSHEVNPYIWSSTVVDLQELISSEDRSPPTLISPPAQLTSSTSRNEQRHPYHVCFQRA